MHASSFTLDPALRSTIERELAGAQVPGCSIALVDAGGLRWAGGIGLADVRGGVPATADTVYHLFSGTKLFTAVAVMQLAERGLLELEDPLARFMPELPDDIGRITLTQLLSHRSGLRETLRGLLAVTLPGEPPDTSAQALARYRLSFARRPGTKVEYRNVNFALLGEVISRVGELEYREAVARDVLAPLGMQAGFAFTDAQRRLAATGTIQRWDPMRLVLRVLFPHLPARIYGRRIGGLVELGEYQLATAAIGGLVGSMPELAKLLIAQLAGGGGILSEASTRRMQTRIAEGAAGIESRAGIGLGWKLGRTAAHAFLNHEGGGAGFTTELRLYPNVGPNVGIGIALGMNMMRMPATMRVAHRICEALLARLDGGAVTCG